MINYNIEEQQRLHQQYIRQMQESMRRAQERSLMESIYSPTNSPYKTGDGSTSAFGGGGDPNASIATGENNYVVDDYIDDYFE